MSQPVAAPRHGLSRLRRAVRGEFGRTIRQVGGVASYPVAAVVLLKRVIDCVARSQSISSGAKLMVGAPYVNVDADELAALFDVVTNLIRRVPVVTLQCTREDPASDIISLVRRHADGPESTRAH